MFTLKDIACQFGLKLNTLRYWLKKNYEDCENEFYDYNLMELTQRIKVFKKTVSTKKICRSYEQIIVLDIDEFKTEFEKYIFFIENLKKKRRVGNLSWTNSAIECFKSNMDCENCFNKVICRSVISKDGVPPMKCTVKKLLAQIGKPPQKL